ncbi:MAG: branched-chain-amino-acid transaminase [Gammaproteobacteria bacterium]|nr:branched-chain-amino-acid transaminase [Gammaproteobacteria bacterium]
MDERMSYSYWINGQIVPKREAVVPVMDHGLLYGDGVFEGICFYQRMPFLLEPHLNRLSNSAKVIGLEIPYDQQQLAAGIKDLIDTSSLERGYLRLLVTRGEGALGLDPRSCSQPNVIIILGSASMVENEQLARGMDLIIASTRRLSPDGLDPRVKSLNYLNHIMARMEAMQAGVDEAVLLNREGRVTEGSVENIFVVKEGLLKTPPSTDGALEGITRNLVMELARQADIQVAECSMTSYDLYTADECFLTGTLAGLVPVRSVDGRKVGVVAGSVYANLRQAFEKVTNGLSGTA